MIVKQDTNYWIPILFWATAMLVFALLGADRWTLGIIIAAMIGDVGKTYLFRRFLAAQARKQG